MVDDAIRSRVRALLDAVRERPTELPMAELVELAGQPVQVAVDRAGEEPVVFVSPRPDPRFDALSPREYEVATLVAAGFSNRQIGQRYVACRLGVLLLRIDDLSDDERGRR